jgi:DNA-binding transcriptional regulator YiaG
VVATLSNDVTVPVGTFDQWVYAFRVHLDMTQKSFADYVQTTIPTVQRWESGQHTPTGPVLLLFALLADAHNFVDPPGIKKDWRVAFEVN